MNSRTRILIAFVIGGSVGIFAGCQTYDFEPVEPLALAKTTQVKPIKGRNAKPNIMLLVDRSGSMHEPLVAGGVCAGCTSGNALCPTGCTTRWRAMETAMGTFLTNPTSGASARFGLAYFPNSTPGNAASQCNPGGVVSATLGIATSADVDSELIAHSAAINQNIQSLPEANVYGGTPTADSLAIIGNTRELLTADREDFVLLLTDGLPNCNAKSTRPPCTFCVNTLAPPSGPPPNCGNELQCLDDVATVSSISSLKSRGIKVIVVGFGSDTAGGPAFGPLNKLAEAGDMARNCLNAQGVRDPDLCGVGDTCDNTPAALCSTRFYKAADAAQLGAALARISLLLGTDVCEFTLDTTPTDVKLVSVTVDGNNVPQAADTWTIAGNKLAFTESGRVCQQLRSTPTPVTVEIGIIETL